jgi:hypothetical protein
MNNTVLLKGKGSSTVLLFLKLQEVWPHATLHEPKTKWWQSHPRYELRIQNMVYEDILALSESLNRFWPLTHFIKLEIF